MAQNIVKVLLVLVVISLTGCANTFDPADAYKNLTAQQIYKEGEKNLKKGYYTDAIQYFETYDARYPFGEDIEQIQLDIIYAYYQKNETASSLAAADRFIHLHPTSKRVDYAYYMRGLSNFISNIGTVDKYLPIELSARDLTSAKKSFLDFSDLVHRFPNSVYTPDAKQHMIFLRNLLAHYEFSVGVFYYQHGAYVAAANRANDVIRYYQGAPIMPKAMVLMIKSYHQLGLDELASDATKVLEHNFPDVPVVEDL